MEGYGNYPGNTDPPPPFHQQGYENYTRGDDPPPPQYNYQQHHVMTMEDEQNMQMGTVDSTGLVPMNGKKEFGRKYVSYPEENNSPSAGTPNVHYPVTLPQQPGTVQYTEGVHQSGSVQRKHIMQVQRSVPSPAVMRAELCRRQRQQRMKFWAIFCGVKWTIIIILVIALHFAGVNLIIF